MWGVGTLAPAAPPTAAHGVGGGPLPAVGREGQDASAGEVRSGARALGGDCGRSVMGTGRPASARVSGAPATDDGTQTNHPELWS